LLAESFDLRRIQRLISNELTDPCLDAIEAAQYLHWRANACSFPAGNRFQLGQYLIKALAEIGEDMIGVLREPMVGVDGRGGATDKDRVRQNALEMSCRGKNLFPLRQL
jgi:hypothetical protein